MSGLRPGTALWIAGLLCGGLARAADETTPPAAQSPPPFRRVFLPATDIESRTWKGGYLPVDANEFEQLLAKVQASTVDAPGARSTQIEKAEYAMRLEGEDLLVGKGILRLARRSDTANMLVLDPCTLALHGAVWQDQNSKPAVLGTGPDGRVRVAVEGSQLSCSCSLRGERTASGAVSFRLELPGSPIARFLFDAPGGLDVTADQGIVSKTAGPAKTNRWTVDLGGHNRVNLRVVREDGGRERRPLTLLRQSLEYEFSSRGINVVAHLKVDVHGEPLQRIAVDLDPSLRLVTARYGELEVPWSATTDVETHVSHVILQMPDPIVGTGRVLQLSAMAPLTRDKLWRLPGLQAEGMSWQEGTATLLIPNSFVLEQLKTEGCRQSRITELPAPLLGESIQIQYYRAGASIEALLTQRREPTKVDTGTLVEVSANDVSSRCTAQFGVARGERHALEIEVNPGWTIDAVENLESNRSVDWEPADLPAESANLRIRLEAPVTADKPVRLQIRGRRRLPSGPVFDAKQLEMLSFDPFERGIRLICVRAAEGSELRWIDSGDLNARDVLAMSPAETQLFPSQPTGLLFVEDEVFSQSTVGFERRRPSYTADIRIDAAVQKQVLTETYTIQCVPEAARVERLLIRFSHGRDVPLEWNLAGGNSGQFSVRKISPGEQAQAGLSGGGEAWEVSLRLARPGPFELRAVRSVAFTSETPLVLASVADATTQRGTLAIRAIGESGLSIQNRRLTSVPAELLEADRYQTARATYHYQPSRDDLGAEAAVSMTPARTTQAESGAWVWSNRLDSRYAADGTCVHWASFRIQTAGRQQIRVSLPADARLQAAWVDQQRLPLAANSSQEDGFAVDLPSGRSFATLSLYYAAPGSLPDLVSSARPPFPTLDIPVMARQWSVWLPPGYEIADASSRVVIDRVEQRSWSQRLFGVLGRSAASGVFNPLAASDWRETFFGGAEAQSARTACEQFALSLGTLGAEYVNTEEPTWGKLLSLYSEVETQPRQSLLIDAESLAWQGLTPQTRVRFQSATSNLDRGLALLRQNNLVLLADRGVVLLTTSSSAASYTGQLSEAEDRVMYSVLPGPLTDELRGATQGEQESRFESVDTWRATPQHGKSPWLLIETAGLNVNEARGWSSYTLQLPDTSEPWIRIVRSAAMRSLAWAIFLALVGIGLWKANRHPVALVMLIVIGASASLLLPAAYLPLTSSAFLAGLFCLALRMMRISQPQAQSADLSHGPVKPRSTASHPVATLWFVGAILSVTGLLDASQPDATRPPPPKDGSKPAVPVVKSPAELRSSPADRAARPNADPPRDAAAIEPVHRVFVPVDGHQNLLGGKYFVPEQLYTQLSRQAATASGQPKGWFVTRGFYEGTLSRDPVNKRLGMSQLKASFDLQVFQPNVRVRLPFARKELANPLAARLEGRTIDLAWNAAGDELIVGPLDAERYRLELDLRPSSQPDVTTASIDLAIPALTNATLELTMPLDAPAIELPTARGEIRVQKDRGKLLAQLGTCSRLAVRWPVGSGAESAAPNLEVEEFIWVKVRPGTTVVDAKFKYRVLAGRVTQIRLLTDPRLRLLPATNAQSLVPHTIPGDPQKIDLELAHVVSDQVVVDLSFLLTGTSGVGNLRLPRLESSGARAVKRWLAVSVDPALQSRVQAGEDSKQLDVAEFTAAWGAADSKPLSAFGIPRGEPMWGLATQPNEPQTTVEQTMALSLGRSSSRVQFDAVLGITGGYLFQLGLQGPKALAIEEISMLEDDVQRVSRWSTDASGRVTVFLTAPVNGRQRLSLRGRVDAAQADSFAISQFQVLGAETKNSQLRLYRQPAVLAEIEKPPGVSAMDPAQSEAPEGFGAPLGCYSIEDPGAVVTVKLAPNVPQSRAVTATYLQRDGDRWVAEVECHADVTEGLADTLEFEIPAQWSEPYRIEPATLFKIVPVPGELRRRMIVYPAEPIHGKYQLKIRGRVALSAGDRLRVPDILPLRVQQFERFVVLPSHLDLQQVMWDTIGLSRAELPADFVVRGPNAQSLAVYQVAGEHFQASLKAVKRTGAVSHVMLADLHVIWQPDGNCQGVATFDLEPGTANSCVLELPPGHRLLHAAVESLPALVVPLDGNRWRLGLGPQQLPQRVEVIYTGPLAGSSSHRRFQAPRLVDLGVDQTLWTVLGPPQFGSGGPVNSLGPCGAAEQHLVRLKSLTALVQLPAEIIGEHLPEEIVRWYRPWKQRYAALRAALDWRLVAARQNSAQAEEALEARKLDNQIGAVDTRLGLPGPDARRISLADASTDLIAPGRADLLPAYYIVNGESHDLELAYRTASDGWGRRLLAGLVVVLVGSIAAVFVRSRPLPTFAPWLVIGGIGLVWWLLLAPSFIGLAVLLGACWAALRARWGGVIRLPVA